MSNDLFYKKTIGVCPTEDGVSFEIEGCEGRYTVYEALAHITKRFTDKEPPHSFQYRRSHIGMGDFYVPNASTDAQIQYLKNELKKFESVLDRYEKALKLYGSQKAWRSESDTSGIEFFAKESLQAVGYLEALEALSYAKRILNHADFTHDN